MPKELLTLSLDADVAAKLRQEAAAERRSLSGAANKLLAAALCLNPKPAKQGRK